MSLDPAHVEAIVDAISDFATLRHEVESLRARLLLVGDGWTVDEVEAMETASAIALVAWKSEELPKLAAWLATAPDAPVVH